MYFAFLLGLAVHAFSVTGYPVAGTEGHRVITAQQMLRDGNWPVPMLFDQPYGRKPPMHYWLIALSQSVFGANEFAWRFPSVLASALTTAACTLACLLWFGTRGAWACAVASVGTIALWAQSRTADIDATHTCASVVCALLILHLDRAGKPRATLIALAGVMFAVSTLLKVPGNLPLVIGAWLAAVITTQKPNLRPLFSALRWIPLLTGVVVFAAWLAIAILYMDRHGIAPDLSGAAEGAGNLVRLIQEPSRFFEALLLPVLLIVYALPVSLGLFTPLRRDLMPLASDDQRVMIRRLVFAFIVGVGLLVVVGQVNPRYGYLLLPLLAVLMGAAVELQCRKTPSDKRLVAYLALCVAAILVVSVLFTRHFKSQHTQRSGVVAAELLKSRLGEGANVTAGWMIFSQPEILWYARANVRSPGQRMLTPADLRPQPQWMLLHPKELKSLREDLPDRLEVWDVFPVGKGVCYLVRYEPPK